MPTEKNSKGQEREKVREQERGEVKRRETPSEEKSKRQELTAEKEGDEAAKDGLNTVCHLLLRQTKKSHGQKQYKSFSGNTSVF